MKVGDLCRCINNFECVMPDELTLYKGDLFQILCIEDKLWVYGIGGGGQGKIPASCIVKVDEAALIPPAASHEVLFVVAANFTPVQDGDLGLLKDTVVIGVEAVDEAWWRGRAYGREGVFPLNFVWRLKTELMLQRLPEGDQPISKLARVLTSFVPQLEEELQLNIGDMVHITHIVEGDWYRGQCNGVTGIFPSNFVEIIKDNYDCPSVVADIVTAATDSPETNTTLNLNTLYTAIIHEPNNLDNSSATCTPKNPNSNQYNQDFQLNDPYDNQQQRETAHSPVSLEYTSNIVGLCGPPNTEQVKDGNPRNCLPMNTVVDVTSNQTNIDNKVSGKFDDTKVKLSKISTAWKETTDDNIYDLFDDDYFKLNMPSMYKSKAASKEDSSISYLDNLKSQDSTYVDTPKESHTTNTLEHNYSRDSITRQVDDYFDHRHPLRPSLSSNVNRGVVNSSRYDLQVDEMLQMGYTEDNTGINPYAKAIYEFHAQYPNELSFKKDEIIYLLKHVDSHWTLGTVGEKRGIFPTSYVEIVVDCVHGPVESFLMRPLSATEIPRFEGFAVAEHCFIGMESGDVSIVTGERIKVLECIDENWALVETSSGDSGMCPRNHFMMVLETETKAPKQELVSTLEGMRVDQSVPVEFSEFGPNQQLIAYPPASVRVAGCDANPAPHPTNNWNVNSTDTAKNKRVYSKNDFGPIKVKHLDEVLNDNLSSLDQNLVKRGDKKSDFCIQDKILHVSTNDCKIGVNVDDTCEAFSSLNLTEKSMSVSPEASVNNLSNAVKPSPPVRPPFPERSPLTCKTGNSTMTIDLPSDTSLDIDSANSVAASKKRSLVAAQRPALMPKPGLLTRQSALQSINDSSSATTCKEEAAIFHDESSDPEETSLTCGTANNLEGFINKSYIENEVALEKNYVNDQQLSVDSSLCSAEDLIKSTPTEKVGSDLRVSPCKSSCTERSSEEFPADVQHDSASSCPPYNRSTSGLAPHRPAPPPPSTSSSFDHENLISIQSPVLLSIDLPKAISVEYPEVELRIKEEPLVYTPARDASDSVSSSSCVRDSSHERLSSTLTPHIVDEGAASSGFPIVGATSGTSYRNSGSINSTSSSSSSTATTTAEAAVEEEKVEDLEEDDVKKLFAQRRELAQELLLTEIEYIHDLEALKQVASSTVARAKEANVDLATLMGNLDQVISAAKSLQRCLQVVAYDDDSDLTLGPVFVSEADSLCQAYKVYCAHHTTVVEPLLSQYQQQSGRRQYLEHVLQELQQHKIQLLDMRSVLIKPVQRILKYPLFLDRLLSQTPPHHPDFAPLQQATHRMATVATEVNSHTKRMDMVRKYGHPGSASIPDGGGGGGMMAKFSLHSLAKKGARVTTRLSASLGMSSLTEDVQMSCLQAEYRRTLAGVRELQQQARAVLHAVTDRHHSECALLEGLSECLLAGDPPQQQQGASSHGLTVLEAVCHTVRDVNSSALTAFEHSMEQSVLSPLSTVLSLTPTTDRLLLKREHKMLDYDRAQHRMDRNRDPSRTRVMEEELERARSDYTALHSQLVEELPLFNTSAAAVLANAVMAYVTARTALQGRLAKKYCALKQSLSSCPGGDSHSSSAQQQLQACEKMASLSFVPDGHFAVLLSSGESAGGVGAFPRGGKRKMSTGVKSGGTDQEGTRAVSRGDIEQDRLTRRRAAVLRKYLASRPAILHSLTADHFASESLELDLLRGAVVAVLKSKDPLGSTLRWFVDDGERTGFVTASLLCPYQHTEQQPALPQRQHPNSKQSNPTAAYPCPPAHPTAMGPPAPPPRFAQGYTRGENPPKYEDLFPSNSHAGADAVPVPSHVRYGSVSSDVTNNSRRVSFTRPASVGGNSTMPRVRSSNKNSGSTATTAAVSSSLRSNSCAENSAATQIPSTRPSEVAGEALDESGESVYCDAVDVHGGVEVATVTQEDSTYEEIAEAESGVTHHVYEEIAMGDADSSRTLTLPQDDTAADYDDDDQPDVRFYYALYKFGGNSETHQLSLYEGQVVLLLLEEGELGKVVGAAASANQWCFVENRDGEQGYVPASYLAPYSP